MNFFRKAVPEDVPEMAGIESLCDSYPAWGEKGLLSGLQTPFSEIFVCVENGIAGFIAGKILPPELQIEAVVVHPGRRRIGIGKLLVKHMLSEAALKKCSQAQLEADETNMNAIRLYQSLGFKIVGRRPKFYNGLRDALLMNREI